MPAFSRELRLRRAVEVGQGRLRLRPHRLPAVARAADRQRPGRGRPRCWSPSSASTTRSEGLGQLLRNVDLVRRSLNPTLEVTTIVLVMYDARTKLSDQVVAEVREHFGEKVCRTVIPRTVRLSEAPSFGQPIIAFDASLPRAPSPTRSWLRRSARPAREVSMARRSGLGKGLASLIPPASAEADDGEVACRDIPLAGHRAQPRPAPDAVRRGVARRAHRVDPRAGRPAARPRP